MNNSEYLQLLQAINDVNIRLNELAKAIEDGSISRDTENTSNINDTQDALCEASTDTEERLADIEDALCELSEG